MFVVGGLEELGGFFGADEGAGGEDLRRMAGGSQAGGDFGFDGVDEEAAADGGAGGHGVSRPGMGTMASPTGAPVSRTRSAKSWSFLPVGWRLGLASLWAVETMATTLTPRWRKPAAISMGTTLQPLEEMTRAVSRGRGRSCGGCARRGR